MSQLEEMFALQVRAAKLPKPAREYRFAAPRRWRLDFAWPAQKIAVEVEGGVWVSGRHSRGAGYQSDCEKYNAAVLAGWQVLRFTAAMIRRGDALKTLEQAIGTRS